MTDKEIPGDGGLSNPEMYKSITELQLNPPKYTLPNGVQVDMAKVDAMSPADFNEWFDNVADANPEDVENAD